jgi:hypothetical protein
MPQLLGIASGLLALLCIFSPSVGTAQQELPSGRLSLEGFAIGLGIGFTRGEGTLVFAGQSYPFSFKEFTLASGGASKVDAIGVVYNLNSLSDFAGRYTAIKGSFTAIQGGGSALLKNQNNVLIQLQMLQRGLQLTLGGSSMEIALAQPDWEKLGQEEETAGNQ